MPYVKVPRVYRIVFDPVTSPETTVPGLEILSKALTFGEVLSYQDLGRRENVAKMMTALISWDMTAPDGTPIPLTPESFDALDWLQGAEILEEWTNVQMGNLEPGKSRNSGSGQNSEEGDLQIPMETP